MFTKTLIQAKAISLFISGATRFLLFGGSRCFAKGTLVQTSEGRCPIETINIGQKVLSIDTKTGIKSYKKVLKTYHNTEVQLKKMITFTLSNGTQIECTDSHELYIENVWEPAGRFARRVMETNKWNKRKVLYKQFREAENVSMEKFSRDKNYETSSGFERLSKNNDSPGRDNENRKNAPAGCRNVVRKPGIETVCKSHRSYQVEQSGIKSGMVYNSGKHSSLCETRATDEKQRRKERLLKGYRATGPGNKTKIQEICLHEGNVSEGIRTESMFSERYSTSQELGSRCLEIDEIIAIDFYTASVPTYDLCVEDNHNYTVSKDNIIVHNSGKSFIIIYSMIIIACKFPESRHLICRFRFNHVKNSIWLDTLKKVLKICFPALTVKWNNQDYYITLPNGSEIWIGGLDDKERSEKILGMEFLTIFVNEASQISYDAFTTLLTRLAQKIDGAKNMLFVDENPPSKKHWSYKLFVENVEPETNVSLTYVDQYGRIKMNPADNLENISEEYLRLLESLPERKKKRFLRGEFGDDNEGALWMEEDINRLRVLEAPVLKRIVVAIDPAVTSKDTSDETGIVVAGVGHDNEIYVLEDITDTYTPTQWATESIRMFHKWKADRIVAEVNNGGDLVETIIKGIDRNIPYSKVHATRDKLTRAEPISALYEKTPNSNGRVHHVGSLPDLELEMTSWEAKKGEKSPNRIDALVWAITDLIELQGTWWFGGVNQEI